MVDESAKRDGQSTGLGCDKVIHEVVEGMKYRVWLSETELLPVEIDAESPADAQQKIEEMLYKGTLWEENSIEIGEGCLAVNSVERV